MGDSRIARRVRHNGCVHLPGRLQRRGGAQDHVGCPIRCNTLLVQGRTRMAKRKNPATPDEPSPSVRENFRREIEQLLSEVPPEQWADDEIRGVLYEFVPWHRMSSVTIQTRDDDPRDIGAWKYYFSAESDGSLIREEHEAWHKEKSNKRLVYHKLLIE